MNPENPPLESFASIDAKRVSGMPRRIRREPANGFGARLAALRKQAGITQTALAEEIGVSQRMMAYYEGPSANPPANLLPAMASALGVSVEALLGTETAKRKTKAVDTRMQRRLPQIASLPPEERRQILQLVDAFIERGQLKKKVQAKQAA
jgi:transcriptional regulator with XRE-family HTH domain